MKETESNIQDKKAFYSDSGVVRDYDDLRFKNPGGQYVHQRESQALLRFLASTRDRRSILDIPTGTGRMIPGILTLGFEDVHISDYSTAMLDHCRAIPGNESVAHSRQDIYRTTFEDETFSAVLSSRFLFHSDQQDALFAEFARILRPGGHLVFDTLSWSPRTWTSLWAEKLGGRIYTNSRKSVRDLAAANGFSILNSESMLVLPSFFYNFMPRPVLKAMVALERIWPKAWMTKRAWILRKND